MSEEKYLYAIIKVPIKITNNKPTILPEYSSIIFEKCDQISENTDSKICPEKISALFETIPIPNMEGSPKPPEKLFITTQEIKKHRSHKTNISFKNKNSYTSRYTVKNYSKTNV
jgi:hypothetical protein